MLVEIGVVKIEEVVPRLLEEAEAAVKQYVRRLMMNRLVEMAEVFLGRQAHEVLKESQVGVCLPSEPLDSLIHRAVEVRTGRLFHARGYAMELGPLNGHAQNDASIFWYDRLGYDYDPVLL